MNGRSLTMLVIPTQASSPNNQPTTPNGRPSTWSLSAQRKMARLYLYTTLPAEKIRAIINAHSPDRTIKQSSANKRLQSLFDKEPRWLHPHDTEDMGRRITELANSPTQLRVAWETHLASAHRSHEQPSPFSRNDYLESGIGAGSRPSSASPSDECSDSVHSSDAFSESHLSLSYVLPGISEQSPGENWGNQDHSMDVDHDDGPFTPFLQQTTFMTGSSARTTGTFRSNLHGYTEPYIKVVKRLVKRFTSPALDQPCTSSQHDMRVVPNQNWIGATAERDSSAKTLVVLPGEFLTLDFEHRLGNAPGVVEAWRLWFASKEHHDQFYWVTPFGLTDYANDLLTFELTDLDNVPHDCFRNTVLHFLAACATPHVLHRALASGASASIINAQNTAGQTFMHLINVSNGWNYYAAQDLVQVARHMGFNMCARDCYGRSSFHILSELNMPLSQSAWADLDPREYLKRDVDGKIPFFAEEDRQRHPGGNARHPIPSPALDPQRSNNPEVSQESQLLQNIRLSFTDPFWEDQDGHNGLHCLAMATLSLNSLSEKHRLKEEVTRTRGLQSGRSEDSSTAGLENRYDILQSLLNAGLDPNHRDRFGNTPLMAFAAALPEDDGYKTGPAILKSLISRGADVNARNRMGDTALHVAVRFHRKLAIRALTEGGANVHVKNARDQSLLDACDEELAKHRHPADYGKYSACRAWLSGQAFAVQSPALLRQWVVEQPDFCG